MKKLTITLLMLVLTAGLVLAKSWGPVLPVKLSWSIPRVKSVTIAADGDTLTIVFSEAVTQGSAYDDADLDADCSTAGNDVALTYSSGDETKTHVYGLGVTIATGETCNLDFNGDINSLENMDSNDVAAIVSASITNSSTQ